MKAINTVLKFFAFITVVILVVAIPLGMLVFDVWRVIFNPPLVKGVVTDIVVESDLLPAALAWFSETEAERHVEQHQSEIWVTEPNVNDLIDFMVIDHWRNIKIEVLTREILAEFVSDSIDSFYAWIDSNDSVPQVMLTMGRFIDRVNTEHGVRSIEIAYSALPPCTPEQVADFETRLKAAPSGTEVLYNLCHFPDPYFEDQFNDYLNSLHEVVDEIPVKYNLTQAFSNMQDVQGQGTQTIKNQLRLIRFWGQLAPVVIVVIMLLVLLFGIRSWVGLGRWWGVPLVLGGLLCLIMGLVYRFVITFILSGAAFSEIPPILVSEFTKAVVRLADEIFKPMLFQSFLIILVGIVLLVVAAVLGKKEKKNKEEVKTAST